MQKYGFENITRFTLTTSLMLSLAGCASQIVTPDSLNQRTSAALGLEISQFTISDRQDDAVSTRYRVKTNDGLTFSCTVGGAFSITGPIVTDAICNPFGKTSGAATQNAPGCNALLKAAGQC